MKYLKQLWDWKMSLMKKRDTWLIWASGGIFWSAVTYLYLEGWPF